MADVASNNPFITPASTTRATNVFGIPTMRSGQYIGMGFLESIIACYTNLVYKPISLALIVFLLFIVAAEFNNSDGPIEDMIKFLKQILDNKDEPQIIKSLASLFLILFNFLAKNKIYFVSVAFIWIPYAAKPSRGNMVISLILTMFTIFGKHSFIEILLLANCFFLYTELRTPWQKLAFALLGVTIFIVGISNVSNYLGIQELKQSAIPLRATTSTTPRTSSPKTGH